jgi:hypothetical protein
MFLHEAAEARQVGGHTGYLPSQYTQLGNNNNDNIIVHPHITHMKEYTKTET